ncbi:hypothetical protein [Bremerella sp.]|uniref:hypothetical protein n=1 Tax=Bremerella sp. TaxID=2795602 RepID=UPI00391B9863
MKLTYNPDADSEFQYKCAPHTPARKAAVDAIRNGPSVNDLVTLAEARHGYTNTDGYFGITYPSDLDDHDRANGESIPNGFVHAIAWYGANNGETHELPERDYLELLRQFLLLNQREELANRVRKLLAKDA